MPSHFLNSIEPYARIRNRFPLGPSGLDSPQETVYLCLVYQRSCQRLDNPINMPKITSSQDIMGPLLPGVSAWYTAGIHRTTGTGRTLSGESGEDGLFRGDTSWREISQVCYMDQLLLLANSVVSESGTGSRHVY